MKAQKKGHIVAISSLSGMFPLAFSTPYTSTKYAVRGMMRTLRLELKTNQRINGDDIHATTVFPNFLRTNDDVISISKKYDINTLYPLISGQEAAKAVVEGMLRNQEEVIIPGLIGILYNFYESFPPYLQDLLLTFQTLLLARKLEKTN